MDWYSQRGIKKMESTEQFVELNAKKIEAALLGNERRVMVGRLELVLRELSWRQAGKIKRRLSALFHEHGLEDLIKTFTGGGEPGADFLVNTAGLVEKLVLEAVEPLVGILVDYAEWSTPKGDWSLIVVAFDEATESEILMVAKEVFALLASPLLDLISNVSGPIQSAAEAMKATKAAEVKEVKEASGEG
jgi:hypothetical protein